MRKRQVFCCVCYTRVEVGARGAIPKVCGRNVCTEVHRAARAESKPIRVVLAERAHAADEHARVSKEAAARYRSWAGWLELLERREAASAAVAA